MAKKSRKGEPHDPAELVRRARAKLPPLDLEAVKTASTWEQRGLAAMKILHAGRWDDGALLEEVATAWGVKVVSMATFRRAGMVAIAALEGGDLAKDLELVRASFRTQADEARAMTAKLEACGRLTLAAKYRDVERKAEEDFARFSGLDVQRFSVSLEGDPRLAGLWPTLHRALADLDRMREAYIAEVVKLTGGIVPTAPLPVPSAAVREAVHRYEIEIGARKKLAA